ncbi:MAG: hypothetical protein JSU63_17845 [Phycisphaerales bacterium]|nr:MAG: hypothetical protein JSU63_17845 [Phycisphaerales bacterium]
MEPHFLNDVVSGEPGFQEEPWYNPHGDCIVHKIADEAVVADRVDDLLTLYRSAKDSRVIGYQIKGVMALVTKFGWDGLLIECTSHDESSEVRSISIAALLLTAFGEGPNTVGRRVAYAQTVRDAGAASIPQSELLAA